MYINNTLTQGWLGGRLAPPFSTKVGYSGDFNLPSIVSSVCHGPNSLIYQLFLKFINSYGFHQFVTKPTRESHILDLVLSTYDSSVSELHFLLSYWYKWSQCHTISGLCMCQDCIWLWPGALFRCCTWRLLLIGILFFSIASQLINTGMPLCRSQVKVLRYLFLRNIFILGFCFYLSLFFVVSVPCVRLSWLSHQLLSAG